MEAIVILGCRIAVDDRGRLMGAAARRVEAAVRTFERSQKGGEAPLMIATGGRAWNGVVEADAIRKELVLRGIPAERIVRERCSFHTVDNARFTAELLTRHEIHGATLVTCDWHLPRASRIFERTGIPVRQVPAPSPRELQKQWLRRTWLWGRERVATFLSLLAMAAILAACSKPKPAVNDAGLTSAPATNPADLATLATAEDRRRAVDVSEALATSRDVTVRRRAARALARIADEGAIPGLMRALSDEDDVVVTWGAYGLGQVCKSATSKENPNTAALVARAASLGFRPGSGGAGDRPSDVKATSSFGELDPRAAIARGIARCGGANAEATLVAWVRARGPWAERAAYGLGDLAGKRGALSDEAITALLDASVGGAAGAPIPSAFYALGRIKRAPDAFADRIVESARGALAHATPDRIFALRALGKAGNAAPSAAAELVKVVRDRGYSFAERAEAARALGQLDAAGRQGIGDALAVLVPDKDPLALLSLAGGEFGVLDTLADALKGDVPKSAEGAVSALAHLNAPASPPPVLARRLAELRCSAASALAKGAYDNDLLTKCDAAGTPAYERARLTSLLRRPLTTDRLRAWIELTKSQNIRVREAAVEAIGSHAELAEPARTALAEALKSGKPGLVATASDVIHAHPERVSAVSREEQKAALDPAAPPPTAPAARELDPKIATALSEALHHAWSEDLIETRVALIDAAAAVNLKGARDAALAACKSPNTTVRQRATKALTTLAPDATAGCVPPAEMPLAEEVAHPLTEPTKLALETDAGRLTLVLEPEFAPVAATRIVALAKSGFFKEMVVHRVVPGFVAQFGDPGGDGFGGSGRSLRCETSPVPFEPLTVGVALAGRDTGSSQIFVTLARTPHLDGEYARIGRADGDWAAIAEGDVIHEARVVE